MSLTDEQRDSLIALRDNLRNVEHNGERLRNAGSDDELESAYVDYVVSRDNLGRAFDNVDSDSFESYRLEQEARRDADPQPADPAPAADTAQSATQPPPADPNAPPPADPNAPPPADPTQAGTPGVPVV